MDNGMDKSTTIYILSLLSWTRNELKLSPLPSYLRGFESKDHIFILFPRVIIWQNKKLMFSTKFLS